MSAAAEVVQLSASEARAYVASYSRPRKASLQQRLEANYQPDTAGGCWLWTGVLLTTGYGQICVSYRKWLAHRFSWTLTNGPIPEGVLVLHKCDVRACVNPDHLFLGSHHDNTADCINKGRWVLGAAGEACPASRLSLATVRAIRADIAAGLPASSIAAKHDCSARHVRSFRSGSTWRTAQ